MPRNGSGTYSKPSGTTATANTLAESAKFNELMDDVASALTASVAADGQTPMTGNLAMGSNKLTGLAAGTAAGNSVRYEQVFGAKYTNTIDDATNNDVTRVIQVGHTTSGSPAAGIGAGIEFNVETSASNNEILGAIDVIAVDATAASEDGAIVFKTMKAGATASEAGRIAIGATLGSPTGGDKGAGTINVASNFYQNGNIYLPVGTIIDYAGTTEPAGWAFCYGQAVSRTDYADLFTALSTVFGAGDGSTTFNLPDLRGRVVAGQDDMGGSSANRLTSPLNGDTFGAAGGAESVTLDETMIPAHTHLVVRAAATDGSAANDLTSSNYVSEIGSYGTNESYDLGTSASEANAGLTSDTGGGAAHANVQPTIILNKLIKLF